MDSYFMVDIKMNKEKEKQYREEFEARDIFKNCPWLLEKNQNEQYESCIVQGEFDGYLAGRKKGDEENSLARVSAHLRGETVLLQAEEIAQIKSMNENQYELIIQLKEQLKREAELLDLFLFYYDSKLSEEAFESLAMDWVELVRSVQAERGKNMNDESRGGHPCPELLEEIKQLKAEIEELKYLDREAGKIILRQGQEKIALRELVKGLIESHEGVYGEDFWKSPMGIKAKEVLGE